VYKCQKIRIVMIRKADYDREIAIVKARQGGINAVNGVIRYRVRNYCKKNSGASGGDSIMHSSSSSGSTPRIWSNLPTSSSETKTTICMDNGIEFTQF
jgi:hypothetical protein